MPASWKPESILRSPKKRELVVSIDEARKAWRLRRALARSDAVAWPGPRLVAPIAEQLARVPAERLAEARSHVQSLADYRDTIALAKATDAAEGGIRTLTKAVRCHGQVRLMLARDFLRHFVRQARPWAIDPYAVLRHLMAEPTVEPPRPPLVDIPAPEPQPVEQPPVAPPRRRKRDAVGQRTLFE